MSSRVAPASAGQSMPRVMARSALRGYSLHSRELMLSLSVERHLRRGTFASCQKIG